MAPAAGWHRGNLRLTLRDRCGVRWQQEFHDPRLNINEVVETPVPRLLPEETIRAIRKRLKANRTHLHEPPRPVHDYLLGGRVFCAACGYGLTGQAGRNGELYYRHSHKDLSRDCPLRPRPWVRADPSPEAVKVFIEKIEEAILVFRDHYAPDGSFQG
jgi:hypothetical protein